MNEAQVTNLMQAIAPIIRQYISERMKPIELQNEELVALSVEAEADIARLTLEISEIRERLENDDER